MKESFFSGEDHCLESTPQKDLRARFLIATSQTFSGLALDIDGTIMEKQEEVDPKIYNIIRYLLRSFIPVIIVTGRGFGSTERLIENKIPKKLLSHLFVANYNGASIRCFQNENWEILSESILEERDEIFNILTSSKSPIYDVLVLNNSDFVSKVRAHSITLVCNDVVKSETRDVILNFLASNGVNTALLKVMTSGKTIDIIPYCAGKQNTISQIASQLGIDHSKVARIGDQGQRGGNDHDMLQHSSGFSVGFREHENNNGCHPVVNEYGEILQGVTATSYLISNMQFDPGCVIDGKNFYDQNLRAKHQRKYDTLAELARTKYRKEISHFLEQALLNNKILSNTAKTYLGNTSFENIFSFNGAVTFSSQEINSIPSNWENFIFAPSDSFVDKFKYTLKYGTQFYSRGEAFYTTLKDCEHPQKNIEELVRVLNDLLRFLPNARQEVDKGNLSIVEFKVLISYFDHLHIVLMHIFHTASYLEQHSHSNENSLLQELREIVFMTTSALHSLLSLRKPDLSLLNNAIDIKDISRYLTTLFEKTAISGKPLFKAVRGISETDHPLQNAIYAQSLAERLFKEKTDLNNLCIAGLHYGGIELPFVLDHYLRVIYGNYYSSPEYLSVHYSRYSNGKTHQKLSDIFDITDRQNVLFKNKKVLILDDGVFSAASIQKIGWLFTLAGGEVFFSAMSIANNRRIGQILDEAGADSSFLEQELAPDFIRVSPFMRVFLPEEYHAQRADHRLNLIKTRTRGILVRTYKEAKNVDPYSTLRDETVIRHPINRRNKDLFHLRY